MLKHYVKATNVQWHQLEPLTVSVYISNSLCLRAVQHDGVFSSISLRQKYFTLMFYVRCDINNARFDICFHFTRLSDSKQFIIRCQTFPYCGPYKF